MGKLTQNTDAHEKCSSNHPPSTGPIATATPDVAPHTPTAVARSAPPGKIAMIRARVAGKTSAANTPSPPRATISSLSVFDDAANADTAAKPAIPVTSIRR